MSDPSALGVANAHAYSQRMLSEPAALVALFHTPLTPRHEHGNLQSKPLPTASCLRKISAYSGGFRISQDDDDGSHNDHSYAKKRLSFADQHGGQLVLEREFHARDAPIYCNKAITYSLPLFYAEQNDASGWRHGTRSIMERLLRRPSSTSMQCGGRGSEEQKSGWSQPELVSFCVLSCSVMGYVMLSYARTLQPK